MKKSIIIFSFCFVQLLIQAQSGDGWDDRIIPVYKNDVEVARVSLTFVPGFETTGHTDFLAYIDPDLPLDGGTPVEDGIANLNYIRVFEPIRNNFTDVIPIHNEIDYEIDWKESITYFDGLGREIQQTMVKASAYGNDIIVPVLYDDLGRRKIEYLPYAIAQDGDDGSGGYRPSPVPEIEKYYKTFYGDQDGTYPYFDKEYDGSQLNRVLKQSIPGYDWRLTEVHTQEFQYNSNTTSDDVYQFTATESDQLKKEGHYENNTLYKNTFIDEDDHTTIEFKDLQNRVVRKIVNTGSENLITQYVYDDFGLLRYVLPPETFSKFPTGTTPQTFELSQDWIQQYCYYYKYDERKRMAIKKLPGAAEVYMVYNQRDLLVLTQDGNLRNNDDWLFTKYDELNRPIMTGKYDLHVTLSQESMQNAVNTPSYELFETYTAGIGYTNEAYPALTSYDEIYTLTYYDNYNALELEPNPYLYSFWPGELPFYFLENGTYSHNTKGLTTITKTKVLTHDGLHVAKEWLVSVTYYDKYYHPIQTTSDNHVGVRNILSSQINFTGQVEETVEKVIVDYRYNTIRQQFTYDPAGRLIETRHKIDLQDWVVLNNNKYNETGQLTRKQLHQIGNSFLQKVDYKYNIRGWLRDINDVANPDNDLFSMKLEYNGSSLANQYYNGNIASMAWKSAEFPDSKQYNFTYDGANRLTSAIFQSGNTFSTTYSYDKNGNINSLTRLGELAATRNYGLIDDLSYAYTGNQLKFVNDSPGDAYQENGFTDNGSFLTTNEYFYDMNGNLTKDMNKQIDNIDYNYLNLPQHITILSDGYNYIDYIYTADGTKLQKTTSVDHDPVATNDYLGSIVYTDNEPDYIFTPEGRALYNSTTHSFNYEYYLKDHLGNTRVVFDQTGLVLQENNYYPFGMSMGESLTYLFKGTTENQYKYNGKELQDDFGLDWYDYGARMYDAALGRFMTQDRCTEKYYSLSPYQYAANNPIKFIDVNGDSVWVSHGTGFLGLGKKESVLYENGNLYNKDGSAYTGKLKGYLKQAKGTLDMIGGVSSGQGLLSQLQSSKFRFTIQRGNNQFAANSIVRASLALVAPAYAAMAGSGGTIYWSPSTYTSGPNQFGNSQRPSFIGLAHELGHASNAEQGMADYSIFDPTNAVQALREVTNDEFNAANAENQVRSEYGLPLRDFYSKDASGAGFMRFLVPATSTGAVSGIDYSISNPVQVPYVGPNSGR